ncbi:MAG TPA: hypothetical protein VKR06_30920 [Ktedonosporobacter sp.]|nr:hypothetical protein [Ktedonosporobacter sp.]
MNEQQLEQIRITARAIAQRARGDRAFREEITQHPSETLTAAGLPEEFVGDFLRETGLADVAGYSINLRCLISMHGAVQDYIY